MLCFYKLHLNRSAIFKPIVNRFIGGYSMNPGLQAYIKLQNASTSGFFKFFFNVNKPIS